MKNLQLNERYSRQISLKDFGEEGQQKIKKAKILVIGAGGLGCPVLQYLAAAGVGVIGIADDDVVSLSNLHRQVLYTTADIGSPKAVQAAAQLQRLNPEITVQTHCLKVSSSNALALMAGYDIIVDGTDNFAARYMINDACVLLDKPLVFAGVYQYEGHVAVFNVQDEAGNKTNYRHLFPTPPSAQEAPGCLEAGVLGVLPGIIGMMQATEVIKLIIGLGSPLINRLLTYNVLNAQSYIIRLTGFLLPDGLIPADKEAFSHTNYEWLCGQTLTGIESINAAAFQAFKTDKDAVFVDVRDAGELPEADFPHLKIPLSALAGQMASIQKNKIVVFCQSGVRSLQAAERLKDTFADRKKIYTLAGGLKGLKQ